MKHEDPSRSQDQPVDTISVDFISILTKLVEDNDNLQKRIETIEKSNLQKRVDTLEKSIRLCRSSQQENEGLQKSMTKLISMLRDSDLLKQRSEPKTESRRPETYNPKELLNDDRRSHGSSKRFKIADEKARGSSKNYQGSSSHESRSSPSRHQYDEGHSRSLCKSGKRGDSDYLDRYQDHHSRRSYDTERSSHERGRKDVSHRNSIHHDAKLPEERHRIIERINSLEHRKRPLREDRPSSSDFSQQEDKDSNHFGENRSREIRDSKQHVENRLRELKDSRLSSECRSKEIRDPKLPDGYRLREIKDSRQSGDCRPRDNRDAKPPGEYRAKENRESVPSSHFRVKESKESKALDGCRLRENEESKQPSDGRTEENKECRQPIALHVKEKRDTAMDWRLLVRESKESKQPDVSCAKDDGESKLSEDCHRSEGEISDDHAEENEDLNRNDPKGGGDKDDGPTDPRLNYNRAPRVDIPSPMIPMWGTTDEIDLKKIHSTPMKFLSSLPTIMNYSMISPLPTTPDQLKEKFKQQQQITVKVSPMPSFMDDEKFEEKREVRQPKEMQKTVEAEPQNHDCVEVKTVLETDDVEHGVFKRRRRAR